MGNLDREFDLVKRRLRREDKLITCKMKRLMFELLEKIEKKPTKYQKKIRRAFRNTENSITIWNDNRLFSRFNFNEMIRRNGVNTVVGLEDLFNKVLLTNNYDHRLKSALGFQKAYFHGYVTFDFLVVDIQW